MNTPLLRMVPTVFGALFALLACAGCGGDADQQADVIITALQPTQTYPGVATTVSFEVTPGENTSATDLSWRVEFGDGRSDSGTELESTVTHAYDASGQYTVSVLALADGAELARASGTIEVLPPLDLAVGSVRGAPANVAPGDALSVSLTVENLNAGPVNTPFDVDVYATSQPTTSLEELEELSPLGSGRVEAAEGSSEIIPAGRAAAVGVDVIIPDDAAGGEQYLVAWVNPDGQLADANPSNNFDVSSTPVRIESTLAGPDVTVDGLVVIPDRAFPTLAEITRTFEIRNLGAEEAFDVVAETFLSVGDDTLDEGDDTLIDTTDPVDVPPSSRVTIDPVKVVLDAEIVPPSGQEIEVFTIVRLRLEGAPGGDANPDNDVVSASAPTVVSDQPADGPDVVVNEFTLSPESTFLDGNLEVTLEIANDGNADTGSFFCGVYISAEPRVNTNADPRLWSINIADIAAESALPAIVRTETFPSIYDPGVYYFYVVCDPLGALAEQYRSNNQSVYLEPIRVTDQADVDIFVDEVIVPPTADEGDTLTVTANVCVAGSNASGQTKAAFYRAPAGELDLADLGDLEPFAQVDVANINPGQCAEVVVETPATCADFQPDYAFGAIVDTADILPERDETNNAALAIDNVTINGPFCSCTPDNNANDSSTNPLPLFPGTTSDAICGAESCDFYSVELFATESVLITTSFDAAQGALETTLFDGSGITRLDRSDAPEVQQVAEFLVPSDGPYVFSVCAASQGAQNNYDLELDILPQQPGVDVLARSLSIPPGDSFSIGADLDLSFRVYNLGQQPTSTPFDANLVISPNPTIGDADDVSLQPASTTIEPLAGGAVRDVSLNARIPTAISAGDYYLGVELPLLDDDPTNNFALSRPLSVTSQCFDPLEPNDGFAEARDLTAGTYSNLVACTRAGDYYRVCASDGERLAASVDFRDADGDIDLELYDEQFNLLDTSANSGVDTESVSVDYVNGGQCYFVYVYIPAGTLDIQTTYSIDVEIQDVDPSLRCDGYLEPNDAQTSAANLLAALQQPNSLDRCPVADTDYYYVNLTAGQTVTLRGILDPANQPGTLRLQIFKPNGDPGPNIETAPGLPVAELTDFVASASGQHLVQVTVSGNTRRATYRLEADGLGGIDLALSNLVIGPGLYLPEDQVRLGFDLENLRSDLATDPSYSVWLGASPIHDPLTDDQLASFTLGSDLAGNAALSLFEQVTLPTTLTTGTGYLHVVVAPNGQTDPVLSNNIVTTPISLANN